MCLRAEEGVRIADKTVLKMMRQMGLRCGIRRERPYRRYNSYKGDVGQRFANIIGRNFTATGPWQKLGTDVTEFKLSFGKAYLAPVYDFASKEIVAHSISMCPNLAQQQQMLQVLMDAKPEGAKPILHSDMGWQYQHEIYISMLAENGFIQSMSRKGNCIDNGATEQVFGHIKDEFFRGQDWQTFESFKADLEAYIMHWNTVRRQVKLKGLTPGRVPGSGPAGGRVAATIKCVQVSGRSSVIHCAGACLCATVYARLPTCGCLSVIYATERCAVYIRCARRLSSITCRLWAFRKIIYCAARRSCRILKDWCLSQ